MAASTQIGQDFELVKAVLTNALVYPSKEKLGEEGYHEAHAKIQSALTALERIKRIRSSTSIVNLSESKQRMGRSNHAGHPKYDSQ